MKKRVGAVSVAGALMFSSLLLGCASDDESATAPPVEQESAVGAVSFTPPPGQFAADQKVTLWTLTSGADIYYSIDGSAPTEASILYTGPLTVAGDGAELEIRAIVVFSGVASEESSGSWSIAYDAVKPISMVPAAGTFSTDQLVDLSCPTPHAEIRFTLDGSEPTVESPLYDDAFWITGDGTKTTVRAVAFHDTLRPSPVAEALYSIDYEFPVASAPKASPARRWSLLNPRGSTVDTAAL